MDFERCIQCDKNTISFDLKDGKCPICRSGLSEDKYILKLAQDRENDRIDPKSRLEAACNCDVIQMIRSYTIDNTAVLRTLLDQERVECKNKTDEIKEFYKEAIEAVIEARARRAAGVIDKCPGCGRRKCYPADCPGNGKAAVGSYVADAPEEDKPETFGFNHPEDGSSDRFKERRQKYNVPWINHTFYWVVHNVIAHSLIGMIPIKPFFRFHDYTSRKLHNV